MQGSYTRGDYNHILPTPAASTTKEVTSLVQGIGGMTHNLVRHTISRLIILWMTAQWTYG